MQKDLGIDYVYVVVLLSESNWKSYPKDAKYDKYLGIEEKAFLSYEAAEKFAKQMYPDVYSHKRDGTKVLIEKIPIGEL